MEEADVVGAGAQVREEVADVFAALAVLLEAPLGADDASLVAMSAAAKRAHGDGSAIEGVHVRLVVEGIDLARAAVHEQEDDALRLAGEMRLPLSERIGRAACRLVG